MTAARGSQKYARAAVAGQMPLLTPPSAWVAPTELPDLRRHKIASLDLETKDDGLAAGSGAGWAFGAGHVAGVCIATETLETYIPLRHPDSENFQPETVGRWLEDHFHAGVRFVFHKAIYDAGWLGTEWPRLRRLFDDAAIDDTMIMMYELDENRLAYSLDSVCDTLGIPGKDETLLREAAASYYGAQTEQQVKECLWKLPARYVGPYGARDAAATLAARHKMQPMLEEQELLAPYQLEIDLVPLIVEMRRRGIRIDEDLAVAKQLEFRQVRDVKLRELTRMLGHPRQLTMKDINQNAQKRAWFDDAKIKYPWTSGTERSAPQASFDSDWMKKIDHWLPQLIVEASQYNDAAEKFLGNYVLGHTHRGRIHAEVHQTKGEDGGTATTRLAYSDPPLQQMSSRHPVIAPGVRSCFLPEPGEVWGAPDFSQQEYRLLVHFAAVCKVAGWEAPVEIYRNDPKADFHNIVVELTGLIRRDAKDANFAKAYRAGVKKFSSMIGKSEEEAGDIYKKYDSEMPFVSRLGEFCESRAQQRGFLKLISIGNELGARAHFDRWEAKWVPKEEFVRGLKEGKPMAPCSREIALARTKEKGHPWFGARIKRAFAFKAVNRLIQGSAAQQTKIAMRACWRERIVPLIQLHDELGVSTADESVGKRVVELMRDAVKLVVPVAVDLEWGKSWGRAKIEKDKDRKTVYGASWGEALREVRTAS